MNTEARSQVAEIVNRCAKKALERCRENGTSKPFHEALLTKELIAESTFERSFSTSFGQYVIEKISEILAASHWGNSQLQRKTKVDLSPRALAEIDKILTSLRNSSSLPDWQEEVRMVCDANLNGEKMSQNVTTDLWIEGNNGKQAFISIKTVKPNIHQTELAKRDMLKLKSHDDAYDVYFGIYYNPYGQVRDAYDWSPPSRIFNMRHDKCVLIGNDYWDFVGGKGTYQELLAVFNEVGKSTRDAIINNR